MCDRRYITNCAYQTVLFDCAQCALSAQLKLPACTCRGPPTTGSLLHHRFAGWAIVLRPVRIERPFSFPELAKEARHATAH